MGLSQTARTSRGASSRFRKDIQGIRAIAVVAVLLYHAGVAGVPGGYVGVDVFFVVSGFLMTGLLTRELEATGTVSVRAFYARRVRRLLPASAATIAAVGALTYVFLPASRWASVAGDMFASTFYVMNWRLAATATNYLASDQAASPLQHFWSLAIEEQFYLLWPILLVLATIWHRRRGRPVATGVIVGIAVMGVPSFVWSVILTEASPGQAYFVSTTRLWELALGGGLAVLLSVWRPRGELAEALATVGVAAIAFSVVVFSFDTPFPGWVALIPTAGTAMLIAAGAGKPLPVLSRWISTKPMTTIGDLSYSLYLWHWPIIVVALSFSDPLPVWAGLLAIAVSFVPAWLTKEFVEDPVRFSDRFRTIRASVKLGLACSAIGVVGAVALAVAPTPNTTALADQGGGLEPTVSDPNVTSSAATDTSDTPNTIESTTTTTEGTTTTTKTTEGTPITTDTGGPATIYPNPIDASLDRPVGLGPDCVQDWSGSELVRCDFGDPNGTYLVALTGDSHAAQWVDALDQIALERGWRMVTFTKSSCPHADIVVAHPEGGTYDSCAEWNRELNSELTDRLRPDLLITTSSLYVGVGSEEGGTRLADGLHRTWTALVDSGIAVVPIRDTPWMGINVPECVLGSSSYIDDCSIPTAEAISRRTEQGTAAEMTDLQLVDMTDRICTPDFCRPVEFGVLVWRDSNHLTNTYALQIGVDLGKRIDQALATTP